MTRTRIQPDDVYTATTYAHAIRKDGLIFIAGQVSKDVDNQIVGKGDIDAQCEQVFKNLAAVTAAAGAKLTDIVKLNIFATNLAFYRPHITRVRDRFFAGSPPATTFVVVSSLSDPMLLLEVDAIAMLD